MSTRPDEDLAQDLFDDDRPNYGFDMAATDIAYIQRCELWLTERIDAISRERDAEKAENDQADWDDEWLSAAKAVCRRAKGVRHQLSLRRAALAKEARIAAASQSNDIARTTFLKVVKDRLGEPAYLDLWEEVYRRNPMLRLQQLKAEAGA